MQIQVINLQHRTDRRAEFLRNNSKVDVEVVWIDAVDGRKVDRNELLANNILGRRHEHFTPGQVGCALSHRWLWEACCRCETEWIICEDDAQLRSDFKIRLAKLLDQLHNEWDFLLLGYNFDSILDVEIASGVDMQAQFVSDFEASNIRTLQGIQSAALPLNNAFGLCCYAISPKGAAMLLQLCFPMTGEAIGIPALERIIRPAIGIDCVMNNHYRRLRAYCSIPPLAISQNDKATSDTVN
jgi:GR25 family glycosyltransferase involved in LPS biosynthesis